MSRSIRPLAIAALLAAPLPAAAQSITGQAAVRPQAPLGVKLTPGGAVKPGATGLSLAGTKVFNPVTEDYEISDKFLAARTPGPPGGTANELTQMQSVIPLVQALVPLAAPPATAAQKAVAEAAFAGGAKEAFKPVAPKPPATVGDFTRITKGVLDTGTASSANNAVDGGLESATARAKQDAVKTPGSLITTGTSATALISASKMLMSPQAAAYAVNIDPTAVQWTSPSSRTVQLDLNGLQLQATTSGLGAAAAATDTLSGAFRDGTDDITQPEDGATSLFSLSLGVFDFQSSPAVALTGLSFLGVTLGSDPGGLRIMDSEGGMGLTAVANDLASSFVGGADGTFTIGNTIDPALDYTITMTLPGTASDSVLYFDDTEAAGAAVLPEPPCAALFAVGIALVLRLRGKRATQQRA